MVAVRKAEMYGDPILPSRLLDSRDAIFRILPPKPEFTGHDVTLTPTDRIMCDGLKHSTQEIRTHVSDFALRRRKSAARLASRRG